MWLLESAGAGMAAYTAACTTTWKAADVGYGLGCWDASSMVVAKADGVVVMDGFFREEAHLCKLVLKEGLICVAVAAVGGGGCLAIVFLLG